jgi:hypothetical protein
MSTMKTRSSQEADFSQVVKNVVAADPAFYPNIVAALKCTTMAELTALVNTFEGMADWDSAAIWNGDVNIENAKAQVCSYLTCTGDSKDTMLQGAPPMDAVSKQMASVMIASVSRNSKTTLNICMSLELTHLNCPLCVIHCYRSSTRRPRNIC